MVRVIFLFAVLVLLAVPFSSAKTIIIESRVETAGGGNFSGSWNDLTDIPAGFADNVDNDTGAASAYDLNVSGDSGSGVVYDSEVLEVLGSGTVSTAMVGNILTVDGSAHTIDTNETSRTDALYANITLFLADEDTTYSNLSEFIDDLGHTEDNESWNESYANTLYSTGAHTIDTNASTACTGGEVLYGNGSCGTVTGGSGTPAGSQGNIQYNDGGSFAGSDSLNWTGTRLNVSGRIIAGYGSLADPSIQMGNGSTGFYATNQYNILFVTNGNVGWLMSQSGLQGFSGGGNSVTLLSEAVTGTNPGYASTSDHETGIGFETNGASVTIIEDNYKVMDIREGDSGGITNGVDIFSGVSIENDLAGVHALLVKGDSGQSENIFEVQDSASTPLSWIDNAGTFTVKSDQDICIDSGNCLSTAGGGGDNSSWNESYASTLFHPLWDYDYADLINAPTHLTNFTDDLGHTEDNESWNESHADTLYEPLGITESDISDLNHYTDADIDGSETAFDGWDKNAGDDFDGDYNSLTNKPTILTLSEIAANLGNWSADKSNYYTSAQVDTLGNWSADKGDYVTGVHTNLTQSDIEGMGFVTGAHTIDTNASTACSGTTTYLDGEGTCDTLDGLEDFTDSTNLYQDDIGVDCGAGDFVKGVDDDGTLDCATPAGGGGGATFAAPGTQAFTGSSPTSWTDLNLSSIVGSNEAMVMLKVYSTGDMNAIAVRPNGDTDEYYSAANDASAYGTALAHHDGSSPALVLMITTDHGGAIEWITETSQTAQVYVESYIK